MANSTTNTTPNPDTSAAAEAHAPGHPHGVFTIGNALTAMWGECQYSAPQTLIEWLAGHANREATRQLRNLVDVMEGVGCLVNEDAGRSPSTGNFQDGRSVAILLFTFASQAEILASMLDVGSDAEYWLTRPEERAERARMVAQGNGHE